MTVWATSNSALRDFNQPTVRSKTFSVPIKMVSLLTVTTYTFFVNGINMGWACKPFGGILGGPLTSDVNGKLNFQFMFDQQHLSGYIANGTDILTTRLTCELRGPNNLSTFFYIPISLKPSV